MVIHTLTFEHTDISSERVAGTQTCCSIYSGVDFFIVHRGTLPTRDLQIFGTKSTAEVRVLRAFFFASYSFWVMGHPSMANIVLLATAALSLAAVGLAFVTGPKIALGIGGGGDLQRRTRVRGRERDKRERQKREQKYAPIVCCMICCTERVRLLEVCTVLVASGRTDCFQFVFMFLVLVFARLIHGA